jgi:hypothetical protein
MNYDKLLEFKNFSNKLLILPDEKTASIMLTEFEGVHIDSDNRWIAGRDGGYFFIG